MATKRATAAGAAVQPTNGDVITQSDLQAVCEASNLTERLAANVNRRIALGATVERGSLIVDSVDDIFPAEDYLTGEFRPVALQGDGTGSVFGLGIFNRRNRKSPKAA